MGVETKIALPVVMSNQGDLFGMREQRLDERLVGLDLKDKTMHEHAVQTVTKLGQFQITDHFQSACAVYIVSPQAIENSPNPQRSIVFSHTANRRELAEALAYEAGDYIALNGMRGEWSDRLKDAVEKVASGGSQLQKAVVAAGIVVEKCPLRDSEIKILQCVADGMSTSKTAEILNLHEQTIKNSLHNIYQTLALEKTDIAWNRASATAHALRCGWVD